MLVIAHRSGPTMFPEQTIESAKYALECGADIIEVDTRFTADNKIVISHDSNTERIFIESKEIDEITGDEYCCLTRKEGSNYHGYYLEDYLKNSIKPLLIHVKEGGYDKLTELIKLLNSYNFTNETTLGLTSLCDVNFVKTNYPNIKVLSFMPRESMLKEFLNTETDYIRLWEAWTSKECINLIHDYYKKVWIMVSDKNLSVGETTPDFIYKIQSYKADGVLINDVTKIKKR